MSIIERPHRLHKRLYEGVTYAFTCCVMVRGKLFVDAMTFEVCERYLLEALQQFECNALVYLFMPDHLHLLLEAKSAESDVRKVVNLFKQKTGYWLSQSHSVHRWQKGYFDHILRSEEDIMKQFEYILENPVRKGIVTDWKNYPYKGSTVYDLDRIDL